MLTLKLYPRTGLYVWVSQVAASANYRGVRWILGFAQCVSSQYSFMLTAQ
jgi:hypothetical protein